MTRTTRYFALATAVLITVPSLAWSMNVVATVNGKKLTDQDLTNALSGMNEGQRSSVLRDYNSRRQVLNGVIDQELLDEEAKKEEIEKEPQFQAAIEEFKKQFLATQVLHKNIGKKLTESSAKRYYEANKDRYSTEQVHAMHILVADEGTAQDLIKKAKAQGTDFQALAEKYSQDPSAKNNRGDLGFFGRGQMVKPFTDAAFAGSDGEIVGPIRTAYGYHIIKVVEHKPGKILEYSDVEGQVKSEMQNEETQKFLEGLRKQAKISVNDGALKDM